MQIHWWRAKCLAPWSKHVAMVSRLREHSCGMGRLETMLQTCRVKVHCGGACGRYKEQPRAQSALCQAWAGWKHFM
jgi:hypothetical protein